MWTIFIFSSSFSTNYNQDNQDDQDEKVDQGDEDNQDDKTMKYQDDQGDQDVQDDHDGKYDQHNINVYDGWGGATTYLICDLFQS